MKRVEKITLDIDGGLWCIQNEFVMSHPLNIGSFGKTINEAIKGFSGDIPDGISGLLDRNIEPWKEGGFVGIDIESVNIARIGYKHTKKLGDLMLIEFNNGNIYHYREVPQFIWREFLVSENKGKYLADNIKGNHSYYHVNGE